MQLMSLKPSKLDIFILVLALLVAGWDFVSRLSLPNSHESSDSSKTEVASSKNGAKAQFNPEQLLSYYQSYGGKDESNDTSDGADSKPELSEAERIKQNDPWKDEGIVLGNFKYRLAGVFIDETRTAVLQSYSYEDGQRRVKAVTQGENMGEVLVSEVWPKYIVLSLNRGGSAQDKRIDLYPQSGSDN
ncbi:hypothetical protein DEU29_102138 [Idiomarina aquatica]|uniref:Uncharacterized protein n=1 Tax=Idiomarina aquatica TaxID=1327752 RepID=A0A4R6PQH7_9GAMM|nr:hypothetical protein [Idiomarina aquatica]TDP40238.1 hypothetical protein DEU29_102138 [Idiomarina aquatica]